MILREGTCVEQGSGVSKLVRAMGWHSARLSSVRRGLG